MLPLTKRQREILDYLNEFIGQHGYAPSLEEIGRRFSLSSLATVHKHLTNLQEKGFIRRAWNRSRSVEVVPSRTGGRAQTRLDAGIKGSWTLQLAGRPVYVAPYMRIVNAFNSSALFYYQQGGSADLRPLSALPTLPVLGVKWEF